MTDKNDKDTAPAKVSSKEQDAAATTKVARPKSVTAEEIKRLGLDPGPYGKAGKA